MVKMLVGFSAILALQGSDVRGQGPSTWGFVNARYDTRTAASMYTGYGWRGAFAMGGVVHNARSGYAEALAGVGFVVRTGADAEHWVVLTSARAGSQSLAQVFWLPTLRTGVVTTRAQVKWTIPYGASAPQKLGISPVSMSLPIWRRVSGGVVVEMSAAERAQTSIGTGLQLRFKLPRAGLGVDALRDVAGRGPYSSRLRCFYASRF